MNYLNVNDFKSFKDFWILEGEKINVVFSNAEMNRSFNRHTEEGINNLLSLKEDFNVNEVQYIRQIHSDKVFVYKGNDEEFIENEGWDVRIGKLKLNTWYGTLIILGAVLGISILISEIMH